MKITLFISLFLISGHIWAESNSIRPDRAIFEGFKLFKADRVRGESVRVSGIKYDQFKQEYLDGANSFDLPKVEYDNYQDLGLSVFEATPGDNSQAFGTAFHIGENLILTNQHVLSTSRKNTTMCKSFSIKLNHDKSSRSLKCKKVHYCNKELDYCLIELFPHKKGESLAFKSPLQLRIQTEINVETEIATIGNPQGFGLHASKGLGLQRLGHDLYLFYAPVFGGNSGGPIFNAQNEVIGLVRAQSPELISSQSYNVAISIEAIMNELHQVLKDTPTVLDSINYIQ